MTLASNRKAFVNVTLAAKEMEQLFPCLAPFARLFECGSVADNDQRIPGTREKDIDSLG